MKKILYVIISILLANTFVNAQCNYAISGLPDTILACKNSIVPLNPVINIVGSAPSFVDTFWTPATNITNPNILNPSVNVATTSTNYILTVQGVTPINLISNGDFSSGNVGFTSSYIPGTGGSFGLLSNPGEYAINTNPTTTHVNFATFGDHSSGSGNMMIMNGSSTPNVDVWCQTITVTPNTLYDFSAWGASCVNSSPAILQFSINGTLIGTPLALPLTTGLWTQFHATWFSGANTSISICINDQATAASGNDFAIDDIAFKQVCEVKDSVYIKVVNLTPAIQVVKNLGCMQDTVQFTALKGIGNTPANYTWTLGPGIISILQNPNQIYTTQGIYNIKLVTELNGCKDSTTALLNTLHPLKASFIVGDTFCVGDVTVVNSSLTSLAALQLFEWGDGTIVSTTTNQSMVHTFNTPGTYHLKMVLKDNLGCIDSASKDIEIIAGPAVFLTITDDSICNGEPVFFNDSINQFTESTVWNFGDGQTNTNLHQPIHAYDDLAGTIAVTLTGKNAKCKDAVVQKNIYITPSPVLNIGKDTSICTGITGAIQLNPVGASMYNYVWNNGTTQPFLLVNEPGKYWATASINGCTTSDTIDVKMDCFLNIPNSFTPNADGANEYFFPGDLLSSGLISFNIKIFNRWGEMVFETSTINSRGWDGKFGGKNQPVGTYVYQINAVFKNNDRKSYTGNVTLLR